MEHEMLVNTIKRVINRGATQGLRAKLDIYFLVGSLNEAEYQELIAMLPTE